MRKVRYMKRILQFVYYGKSVRENLNTQCSPQDLDMWRYNLLANCGPVSHLGIQGEPGTVFYLNHSEDPISLGATGIYELNLEGIGHIYALRFDMDILADKYDSQLSTLNRVLVDVIYEGVEQ